MSFNVFLFCLAYSLVRIYTKYMVEELFLLGLIDFTVVSFFMLNFMLRPYNLSLETSWDRDIGYILFTSNYY